MNRRNFLRGLLAVPAAATLGRVYSFPTNIVLAQPVATYLFGTNAVYCANLSQYRDYLGYSDFQLITTTDPIVVMCTAEMTRRLASQYISLPISISDIAT